MEILLKVQLVSESAKKNQNEKECFLTFHLQSDESKARLLETIVDNPNQRYRITKSTEEYREDQWYEELVAF